MPMRLPLNVGAASRCLTPAPMNAHRAVSTGAHVLPLARLGVCFSLIPNWAATWEPWPVSHCQTSDITCGRIAKYDRSCYHYVNFLSSSLLDVHIHELPSARLPRAGDSLSMQAQADPVVAGCEMEPVLFPSLDSRFSFLPSQQHFAMCTFIFWC